MSPLTIYPALDIRNGAVVRLRQGDYEQQTHYGNNPLERAQAFANIGATWMHLVDLDAARVGGYTLLPLLTQIREQTGLQIQTGGGIRSEADLEALFNAGASRVVIGSLAVKNPPLVMEWLKKWGSEKITIALDTRQNAEGVWQLPIHGWTENADYSLEELAQRYADAGLRHLLCTDIACDGMLSGINQALYHYLLEKLPQLHIQASGGVKSLEDITAARHANCAGVILGRALLEEKFQLSEALAC